ncbi:MAG: hypothetical protein ACXAC2_12735, partial [Candidatus Kariarchaeaceae archaeon]
MVNNRIEKIRFKNSLIIVLGVTLLATSVTISPINATHNDLGQNLLSSNQEPNPNGVISPQNGDSTPPVLHDMYFSAANATAGETITLYANITDDISGVGSVTYYYSDVSFQSGGVGNMRYNSGTYLWWDDIVVNQYWVEGDYYITHSYFYDNANNQGEVMDGIDGWVSPRINISGTTPDTEDVIIDEVLFDAVNATTGETIWLYVRAHDTISGVNRLMGILTRPDGEIVEYGQFIYNSNQDRWEVSFVVNQYWVHGEYYIDWIYTVDNANNHNYNYNGTDYISPIIDIYGTPFPDPDPPQLHDLNFSGDIFAPEDLVKIYVNATDDVSGIESVRVRIHTDADDVAVLPNLSYNSSSGLWENIITIGQYWAGEYHLIQVEIHDFADNYVQYSRPDDFTVQIFYVANEDDDSDGDGMPNIWEWLNGLDEYDPTDNSSDDDIDTLITIDEYLWGTDPASNDTDVDGVIDGEEVHVYFTDPLNVDTDDDGLSDGEEIFTYITDPNDPDSDNDCLPDGMEIIYGLDPNFPDAIEDTDGDGLSNYEEFFAGTDINLGDTDSDTLSDYDEVKIYRTNGNSTDTDNDNLTDPDEIFTYLTSPVTNDTDADGLSDYDEIFTYSTDPTDNDCDDDLLTDYEEIMISLTLPLVPDTDNDGTNDYEEFRYYGSSPLLIDTDSDTLNDTYEIFFTFTDPTEWDSDFDGLNDLQ